METEIIKNFLDTEGRIKSYPSKQTKLLRVLEYLTQFFCGGAVYTETEINATIRSKITFSDFATLRRDLIDFGFLARNKSCTEYRVAPAKSLAQDIDAADDAAEFLSAQTLD